MGKFNKITIQEVMPLRSKVKKLSKTKKKLCPNCGRRTLEENFRGSKCSNCSFVNHSDKEKQNVLSISKCCGAGQEA